MATSDPTSAQTPPANEPTRTADDELKDAEAQAQAASARVEELRRQIDEAAQPETAGAADPAALTTRRSVPALRAIGVGVAALLTTALLATTGYLLWQHQREAQRRHVAAEFAAAARQDIINLMSIDYNTVQDSVQRVLDGSTGRFRANFADSADEFAKALKDEKIITKATVNDTAVESVQGDSAVVLVSATSHREGPQAPKDQQQPRIWRVAVTLERQDGQIKMSAIEFV